MLLRPPAVLAALLSLATVVVATPADFGPLQARSPGRVCGSHVDPEVAAKKEKISANLLAQKAAAPSPISSPEPTSPTPEPTTPVPKPTCPGGPNPNPNPNPNLCNYTIPVYFHVVYATHIIDGGFVPDSQILAQIDVLNEDYTGTGLGFELAGVTRTLNADWFDYAGPETPQQDEMKKALRVGNAATLNLYSVGFTAVDPAGLLGYATFPYDYQAYPKDDGVVLLYSTLPGGSFVPDNLGRTATHECGHWVGLYHTFMNGCIAPGDYVDDTPYEVNQALGCATEHDSCPSPGVDPVHNYMDFSDDACMNNFTPGQIVRLKHQIGLFRGITI